MSNADGAKGAGAKARVPPQARPRTAPLDSSRRSVSGAIPSDRKEKTDGSAAEGDDAAPPRPASGNRRTATEASNAASNAPRIRGGSARASTGATAPSESTAPADAADENGPADPAETAAATSAQLARTRTPRDAAAKRPVTAAAGARVSKLRASVDGLPAPEAAAAASPQSRAPGVGAVLPSPRQRPAMSGGKARVSTGGAAGGHDGAEVGGARLRERSSGVVPRAQFRMLAS
jgi:hypothetical protein